MEEKFCLKWNDFSNNASRAFGSLRSEDFLQDVTLVGDDNCQVAAHKSIRGLSEGIRRALKVIQS